VPNPCASPCVILVAMAEAPRASSKEAVSALPENVKTGLSASVRYMVSNFLAEKHYSKISASLANKWDRFQSMSAAMKLMEQHGVHVPPEEQERLSGLTEAQMIEALVSKMPQQSKEQFQHFFLQLQLIVSTATRVRQALEAGRADLVETAMDDADSTGIAQYILKMSIVQAGSEVTNLKKQHAAFVKDAEGKMSRLVKGQEDAMMAKERLAKAQGELAMFQASANEGIKKVLMAMAGGSATALLHGCLSSWHNYVKKMKVENEIWEEYREEMEAAEQRLIDAKSEQLQSVKNMVGRRHGASQASLVQEVFDLWKADILEAKSDLASKDAVAAMEEKLRMCANHAAESAKKVLARCGGACAMGLRDMCWHEWKTFHMDWLKNKELEEATKAEEKRIAEFLKSHSDNAKGLLSNMSAATDSGLCHEVLTAWNEYYKDEKKAAEFADAMNGANGRFGAFGERNKKGAQSVMERAKEHQETMVYLRIFGAWRLDTRIEQLLKVHQGRIDGKRAQLVGVQKMFREFALQLETNINSGADSNRDLAAGPPAGKKLPRGSMQKTDGSVSLPAIKGSDPQRPGSREGASGRKQAWN